jgi:hypothetical protein
MRNIGFEGGGRIAGAVFVPRAPSQGYPGGPNGPAAVIQGTRGGATWKYAVSQNPAVVDQTFDRTPYLGAGDTRFF